MDGIVIISVLAAVALMAIAAKPKSTAGAYGSELAGMEDMPVSIDNIRKGVQNDWYTCTLVVVDGEPAVHLTGKETDGETYSGIFRISQADWNALKDEGYQVEE